LNIPKIFKRHRILGAAILISVTIAACGPAPLGTSWPAISKLDDSQNIAVAFGTHVVLLDPTTGKPVQLRNSEGQMRVDEAGNPLGWVLKDNETPAQFYSAPILLDDDTLLAPSYDKKLFEVDAASGRVENPAGTPIDGHIVANVTLSDDLIFAGYSDRNLAAFNRSDLSKRWTFETGHGVWSAPLLQDGTLYFPSLDHFLYAVDAESGQQRWKLDLDGAATSSPAYANDRLYVGSFARKIFEISMEGEILSEFNTEDWVWGTPAIVDDVLYAADVGGNVYALNISEGLTLRWKAAKVAARAIRMTPLVHEDYVVVASRDHRIYWLNLEDGSVIADRTRELQGEILTDILLIEPDSERDISEPLVVVGTLAPQELVVAFTLESGERQWTYVQQ